VAFLSQVEFASGSARGAHLRPVRKSFLSRVRRLLRRSAGSLRPIWEFARWRMIAPASTSLYHSGVTRLSRWRFINARDARAPWAGALPRRIVYYLRVFPQETFIQRELAALIRRGIPVQLVVHDTRADDLLGSEAAALMKRTSCLHRNGKIELVRSALLLCRRKPFAFGKLFLYVLSCRYDRRKSLGRDMKVFARAVRLAAAVARNGADHLHSPWASMDAFVALIAARLLGIPYTVHARAYDIHRYSSATGLPAKLAGAAFVITNSRYNESKLRSLVPPEDRRKIHTIYNGIDLSRFRPAQNRPRNASVIHILSVANIVEPKGLEYLLMACASLRDRDITVRCDIIGGKSAGELNYFIELRKLHRRLALEQQVVFLGHRPLEYVLEKYNQADVFVLPAVVAKHGGRDITPNVLIEAMAMQVPVVSTTSGAIQEIVEDGVSGILVSPRDPEALAQAIIRLRMNPALAAILITNARKRVEERFDIEKNSAKFAALFRGEI
jgi:colanic acid/amylovoran biosynthesis glycosyltransferase